METISVGAAREEASVPMCLPLHQAFSVLSPSVTLQDFPNPMKLVSYQHLHFSNEESEAPRDKKHLPRPHSWEVLQPGFKLV